MAATDSASSRYDRPWEGNRLRFAQPDRNQRPLIGLLSANAISVSAIPSALSPFPGSCSKRPAAPARPVSRSRPGSCPSRGRHPFRIDRRPHRLQARQRHFRSVELRFGVADSGALCDAGLEFWQLLVLVFIGAFFDSPGISARQALLPELAQMAGVSARARRTRPIAHPAVRRVSGASAAGIVLAVDRRDQSASFQCHHLRGLGADRRGRHSRSGGPSSRGRAFERA